MMIKFNPGKVKHLKEINAICSIFFHTHKVAEPICWKKLESILVIDFTCIGDLIMLIPVLKILKRNAPLAKISLLCNPFGYDLLNGQGIVDRFFLFNGIGYLSTPQAMLKNMKNIKEILSEVNTEKYDVIIEPRGDFRYIFFMHFIKSGRKASYNYTKGECFLTDVIIPSEQIKHLVDDKLYFLQKLGCIYEKEDMVPELCNNSDDKKFIDKYIEKHKLEGKKIVGIHPGASNIMRMWPYFGQLLVEMYKKNKEQIFLIFEGPNEREAVHGVICHAINCGAKYIVVREQIDNYKRIISLCKVMICNDSGAAHISAAYGVPTVVIFGCNIPDFAHPIGHGKMAFVSKPYACKPCYLADCQTGNLECIKQILVEDVQDAVEEVYSYEF